MFSNLFRKFGPSSLANDQAQKGFFLIRQSFQELSYYSRACRCGCKRVPLLTSWKLERLLRPSSSLFIQSCLLFLWLKSWVLRLKVSRWKRRTGNSRSTYAYLRQHSFQPRDSGDPFSSRIFRKSSSGEYEVVSHFYICCSTWNVQNLTPHEWILHLFIPQLILCEHLPLLSGFKMALHFQGRFH
jgi:hypothetical protein